MSKKPARKKHTSKSKASAKGKRNTRPPTKNLALVWQQDRPEQTIFKKIFWGSSLFILVVTVLMSFGSGINGDEYWQNMYAESYLKWYETMGEDTTAFYNPKGPVQHYGAFFELISGVSNNVLGYDELDPAYYDVRHFWIAIFGVLAMFMTGLFTRQIAGWRAGLLALWLLFLSPRFLGHSLMNPKDIPFAAGYALALCFIVRLMQQLPKPNWRTLLGLAFGIAICVGVRPGGLILVAYVVLFAGLEFLYSYGFNSIFRESKLFLKYAAYTAGVAIAGTWLGFVFWPYALVDPFAHVPESLSAIEDFNVNIRMLFNGEMIFSQDIPPYYTMLWMAISVPLFALIGWLAFAVFSKGIFKKYPPLLVFMAIFTFLFPILYVILKGSPMYDGWRHMIFPYTAAMALVALGWEYMYLKYSDRKAGLYVLGGVLLITAIEPAIFIIKNPKIPYVYFNPLIGGTDGAFGYFETDYWGLSVRQGVQWLEDEGIVSENMEGQITIASDFNYAVERYLKKKYGDKVSIRYTKYRERNGIDWDYGLFASRFIDAKHLQQGTWPTKRTIHTIEAGGAPLLAIMKDDDKYAYRGAQLTKAGDTQGAIAAYLKEVEKDPYNELALIGLTNNYLTAGDLENAKIYIEKFDQVVPESYITQNMWGSYYLRTNDIAQAETAFRTAIELQPDNGTGYYYLGLIYLNNNRINEAVAMAKKAVEVAPAFRAAYELAAQAYERMGDTNMAQAYRNAAQKIGG